MCILFLNFCFFNFFFLCRLRANQRRIGGQRALNYHHLFNNNKIIITRVASYYTYMHIKFCIIAKYYKKNPLSFASFRRNHSSECVSQ